MDPLQQPVLAALDNDVAGERKVAPGGQCDELQKASVECDARSTTWLSIPFSVSTRWIQNPSSPAS